VDIWPLFAVQHPRYPELHFTAPYLTNAYIGLTLDPKLASPEGLKNVKRASVVNYVLVTKVAQTVFPGVRIVPGQTRADALAALCAGKSDIMVTEARTAQALVLARPDPCATSNFTTVGMNTPPSELAIASTKEAATAADTLRAEIERMLADGQWLRCFAAGIISTAARLTRCSGE